MYILQLIAFMQYVISFLFNFIKNRCFRFPTMDVGSIYVNRQAYRNPYEQFNLSTHRISSTYTKGQQTRKSLKGNYPQSRWPTRYPINL